MSSLACGEPLSLTHLPVGKVIRLDRLSETQLAVSLDPLPAGAPLVIRVRLLVVIASSQFIEGLLDKKRHLEKKRRKGTLP